MMRMRQYTACAWMGAAIGTALSALSGCQAPGPGKAGVGALSELPYPAGVDVKKVNLTLSQIPDDPKAPPAADLSTRPAMPQPALRRFDDAKAMFGDHRYAEAVLELEKALRYDQKQYEVQRLLCLACYLSGSESKARLRARETVQLNPQDEAAWYVLARSALKNGQQDEALRAFRTALKCPPDPAAAEYRALVHLHLGLLLDDQGYTRAAIDEFAAFERDLAALSDKERSQPELAAFLKAGGRTLSLRRGRALFKLRDYRAAAAALAAPAAEAPADAALQAEYAEALVRASRVNDAVEVARSHIRQQAASKESVDLLMSVRRWSGQEARIPDDLRALVETYPDRVDLAMMLARVLIDSKRLNAAAEVLRSVQQRQPKETEPAWLLADILRREKRWQDWILALADLMAAREEEYAKVQQAVDDLSLDAGTAHSVVTKAADFAKGKANEAAILCVAGSVARRVGDTATAEGLFRKSIELAPASLPAPLALGEMLAGQFRWKDVIAVGQGAIDAGRKAPQLEWLVGYGYDGLDDWNEALKHYQAAISLNPKDLRTLQSLGLLYERMGDAKKAQGAWSDVLAVDSGNAEARERLLRGYVAREEIAAAASQLVELRDQQGASSPVYRRCEALLKLVRTRNEAGARDYREQLAEVVKANPKDVRTREDYASLLFTAKRYREAVQQVDEILRLDPGSLVAWELRSLLAIRALEYDAAKAAIKELLRRHPNREVWHRNLAEVYLIELQYDQAAEEMRRLIDLPSAKPRQAEYRASLLGIYQSAGRIDEMHKLAEQWLAESPDDPNARVLVLAADEAAKDYARMVKRCRAWLREEDSKNRREWEKRLLDGMEGLKCFAEAEAQVLQWLEAAPNDPLTVAWFAEVLSAAGRHRDAIEWIRSSATGDSSRNLVLLNLLYQAQSEAKDYDGAIATLKQMAAQSPNATFDGGIGRLLIEAKRYNEAEDHLNKLIDRADSDFAKASLLRMLSLCYQKQKRLDLAEQRMREALKLAPDDVGINNDLAYTWADAGKNLDEAEKMLRYVVGENPREAAYLDSLGWVYYKKGDFRSAQTWLLRAVAQSEGRDPLIYDHLGDTCWRLNQPDEAKKRWEQAIDLAKEQAERGLGEQDAEAVAKAREKLSAISRGGKPEVASTAEKAATP
jgi:tetratricopeptide (TPR) repeat protein